MRRLAKLSLISLALAALLLVLTAACEEEEKEESPAGTPTPAAEVPGITDTEIILGQHGPLTGTYGAAYAPVIGGAQAYFKYVNAEEGGVCGRSIVLKVEDDQYLPAGAVNAVRKLVEKTKSRERM